MANLDQGRESLDPGWTLSEALTGGRGDTVTVGGQTKHVVGYMQDFLFSPQQARTALSALSGGERGRLMLARALAKPSNLLVLDEPTNDLDLETLDVLEEMLGAYAGTVILISHDRDFLDRVVNLVARTRRRRPLDRICRRLLRHAGPARRGSRQPQTAESQDCDRRESCERCGCSRRPKRKLSFNDQHALKTLPKEIAALQSRIRDLQERLGDPALYARDRTAFTAATTALAAAQAELATAEEKWLRARDAARGHRRRVTRASSTCHPGTRASAYPGPRATNAAHQISWVPDIRLRRIPG